LTNPPRDQEPQKYHSGLIGFGELSFKLVSAGNLDLAGKYALSCKLGSTERGCKRLYVFLEENYSSKDLGKLTKSGKLY